MSTYTLENGAVLKDGEPLGPVVDGVLTTAAPLANQAKGAIRRQLDLPELEFAVRTPAPDDSDADSDAPDVEPAASPSPAGESGPQQKDTTPATVPPRPPRADVGEHDPALQAWRQQYAPAEWADYLRRFPAKGAKTNV